MLTRDEIHKRTMTEDGQLMLRKADRDQVETVWDRYEAQQPQCGFCDLGLSCRNCIMGPCRIDPFGEGPQRGVCGADADTIVARNLGRMIAAGAASHSDHGRDLVEVLRRVGEGRPPGYSIRDEAKLKQLASEFGVETNNRDTNAVALDLANALEEEYGTRRQALTLLARAPEKRRAIWQKVGITPRGIDRETSEMLPPTPRASACCPTASPRTIGFLSTPTTRLARGACHFWPITVSRNLETRTRAWSSSETVPISVLCS